MDGHQSTNAKGLVFESRASTFSIVCLLEDVGTVRFLRKVCNPWSAIVLCSNLLLSPCPLILLQHHSRHVNEQIVLTPKACTHAMQCQQKLLSPQRKLAPQQCAYEKHDKGCRPADLPNPAALTTQCMVTMKSLLGSPMLGLKSAEISRQGVHVSNKYPIYRASICFSQHTCCQALYRTHVCKHTIVCMLLGEIILGK